MRSPTRHRNQKLYIFENYQGMSKNAVTLHIA